MYQPQDKLCLAQQGQLQGSLFPFLAVDPAPLKDWGFAEAMPGGLFVMVPLALAALACPFLRKRMRVRGHAGMWPNPSKARDRRQGTGTYPSNATAETGNMRPSKQNSTTTDGNSSYP